MSQGVAKGETETRTHYQQLYDAGNGRVSIVMSSRGFNSLFQHIRESGAGRQAFTLWLNLRTGKEMMTIVDERGGVGYYNLEPNIGFDQGNK